jgi:uncharacterized protein (TIGR02001 family)
MTRLKSVCAATALSGVCCGGFAHGEVTTGMNLKSAYVARGMTANDGPVAQPWIEVYGFGLPEEYGSVMVGAWGNYDFGDYNEIAVANSFQETDWYAFYTLPSMADRLTLSVGYMEYMYAAGASDKDVIFTAGYDVVGLDLGMTYYQGVGGGIGSRAYFQFSAGYSVDITDQLSASVNGHVAFVDGTQYASGFHDYSIGTGLDYQLTDLWSAGASITYIGQGDEDVLPDATPTAIGYDTQVVGALSITCSM